MVVLDQACLNDSLLVKKKDKDGSEVAGNIIHCKNQKSRLTIENKMVDVKLGYQGIDRYYGLLNSVETWCFKGLKSYDMNGTQLYGKSIYATQKNTHRRCDEKTG